MKAFLKRHGVSCFCFLLAVIVLFAAVFYPRKQEENAERQTVVRVWNVDMFEGGKGSRTTFLKNAARRAEKSQSGIYYLVSSYSPEGAREAFERGLFPDVLSFGIGLECFLERSLELPYSFPGGEVGGKCYAYPWCRGGYALFSLTENFSEAGKIVISQGGDNEARLCAAIHHIQGEGLPSLTAYTKFLNGEYRYLLGTQRDLCRFRAREKEVFFRPLNGYCDLYQYLSVLNPALMTAGIALLNELISDPDRLDEIGMFSVETGSEFAPLPQKTPIVFTSKKTLEEIYLGFTRGDQKIPEKFLKTI